MISQRNVLSLLLALTVTSCGSVRPSQSSSAKDILVFDTATMKETRLIERDNVVTFGNKRKSSLDYYRVLIADQPEGFPVESLDVLQQSTLDAWREYQGSNPSDEFQRQIDLLEHVLNLRADLSTSDKVVRCRGGEWIDSESEQRYGMSCQTILRVFGIQPTDTTPATDSEAVYPFPPINFAWAYYSNLTSYQQLGHPDLEDMKPIVNKETACYVLYTGSKVKVACGENTSLIHRAVFTCDKKGVCSLPPGTTSPYFPKTIIFGENTLKGVIPGKPMIRAHTWDIVFGREGLHRYEIPIENADPKPADFARMKKTCGYETSSWLSQSVVKRVVALGKTIYTFQCDAQGISIDDHFDWPN